MQKHNSSEPESDNSENEELQIQEPYVHNEERKIKLVMSVCVPGETDVERII